MIITKKLTKTIFPVDIYVTITDNWEEVNKKYNTDMSKYTAARVLEWDKNVFVLCFHKEHFKLKLIVHEVVHLVHLTFDYINYTPSTTNDEVQAYYSDWLFEQIHNFVNKNITK